ncbi:hypothetical protein [Streptomyces sp. NPDC058657]|uniref:hypothetical protein n=1 Tax=unclassified Streptomyces TaxID=2593676 RepID=UPI0036481E93
MSERAGPAARSAGRPASRSVGRSGGRAGRDGRDARDGRRQPVLCDVPLRSRPAPRPWRTPAGLPYETDA